MTKRAYAAKADDGIDVTHMAGAKLTASDAALFKRYQDTFNLAVYWPDVENFRACVAAYDAMIKPSKGQGQ